jgi:hypothetical protein
VRGGVQPAAARRHPEHQAGAGLQEFAQVLIGEGIIMGREELDAQAAFERLRRAARSSTRRLADVARDVTAGQPLPTSRRKLAARRAEQAKHQKLTS